jgi:hypothetical protein
MPAFRSHVIHCKQLSRNLWCECGHCHRQCPYRSNETTTRAALQQLYTWCIYTKQERKKRKRYSNRREPTGSPHWLRQVTLTTRQDSTNNISPVNAKRLLKWCKEWRHWTVDNWGRVIWDDKSRYTMWRSDERAWVWRMPGKRYPPACVVPTVKFGGVGIRVWGCFSWNRLGPFVILHGNLNAEGYKDILTHCILSTVEDQFGDDDCLYQHDNAPCHKARSVRNCLWTIRFQKWTGQPRVLIWIPQNTCGMN